MQCFSGLYHAVQKIDKIKMCKIYIHVYSGHEISSLKVNYTPKKYFLLQTYFPKSHHDSYLKEITN